MTYPNILAVIPARSGSKRLENKNILNFAGKPLIAWTIESALDSASISRVVVSTDDENIADIARQYGAEVPFMRPSVLASDTATSAEVVLDLLEKVDSFDYVMLLQPTSPLRSAEHIDNAVAVLIDRKADAVVSVSKVDHPYEWTGVLPDDGNMDGFLNNTAKNTRSQDFPLRYQLNGAIYITDVSKLKQEGTFILENGTYAYKMKADDSVDIDTLQDFVTALMLFKGIESFKDMLDFDVQN